MIMLEDPALADQGAYWISELERRLAEGEQYKVGQIPSLDGWPVCPVERPDGALALHAHLLEDYRAGRTTVALDGHARLAQAQREFATAYGAFDPPHWLMSVLVCPRWQSNTNVLTREAPIGNASGWVIACEERHCRECKRHDRFHCPTSGWLVLDIAEFTVARAGLARFLGLPPGHRIEARFERLLVESFAVEYGHDIARLASNDYGTQSLKRARAPKPKRAAAIDLDFTREAEIYNSWTTDYYLVPRLCERYGLDTESATSTLERARSAEVFLAYARWHVRDTLVGELRDVVEAALEVTEPERWRVINDTARKLVPPTGKPFLVWKPIVEAFDDMLARAKKARR